jgi:hypothetical protein
MIAALTLAALVVGCSSFEPRDDWSSKDSARMMGLYAAIAADTVTTQRIQYRSDLIEGGRLASVVIGERPNTAETILYMAVMAYGYRALAKRLPPKWRRVIQWHGIADHSIATKENCDNGLC